MKMELIFKDLKDEQLRVKLVYENASSLKFICTSYIYVKDIEKTKNEIKEIFKQQIEESNKPGYQANYIELAEKAIAEYLERKQKEKDIILSKQQLDIGWDRLYIEAELK